ncbi:hypothetical protein ABKA04_005242 [Annulohypoxylon sp. FPYF3050]
MSLSFRSKFDSGIPKSDFSHELSYPSDVFSVLLIVGGDVVACALAQLAGSRVTPVAFSFGWVSYSVAAVVKIFGDNRLMPTADCSCKVINGRTGYTRDNSNWVIGRIVRDFERWMDDGKAEGPIHKKIAEIVPKKQRFADGPTPPQPMAGLCVSIYTAEKARPGYPGYDRVYLAGVATAIIQLALAAIPWGCRGDWTIFLVTGIGILLSFATGALTQWADEKWACGRDTEETFVLTRGNGAQHAIVIIGGGDGLDLEDLAASSSVPSQSRFTKFIVLVLALLWILLLIVASGIQQDIWFLFGIGGIGILDNIFAAGASRTPKDFGIPLAFKGVIGHRKVMQALLEVERVYPRVGKSMLPVFFPGGLKPEEDAEWNTIRSNESGAVMTRSSTV